MREQLALDAVPAASPIESGAVLSPCGRYRYRLWRRWDATKPRVVFVMLNPSTADASVDDPTIRRCMGFARTWGAGAIEVVNLYAFRATDPRDLCDAGGAGGVDVRGPERDAHLAAAFAGAETIVVAWGAHALGEIAARRVLALIPEGARVVCLGKTRSGAPRHPLYLASSTQREAFEVPRDR